MADEFADLALTTLAAAIGPADTSITVVDGSRFKTPTVGYEVMIAENEDDPATVKRETVRVTGKAGNTFTVTRNAWGEGAQSFSAGASFEQRLLASSVAKYEAAADTAGKVPIGGEVTGGTAGSVLFVGAGGVLDEDNAGISYDVTSKILHLGSVSNPAFTLLSTAGGAVAVSAGTFGNFLYDEAAAFTIQARPQASVLAASGDANSIQVLIEGSTGAVKIGSGTDTPDYKLDVNGSLGFAPGASVAPVENGDVVIEATNNTTLTLKLKGSDAVVRSVALTLT